mmetsp:Transcript_18118/g.50699  ORF Transcript_18118/g.50699 Transcript_18118/m.50699 type:complete len:265 (+) Transcript_18118:1105-1899(+)
MTITSPSKGESGFGEAGPLAVPDWESSVIALSISAASSSSSLLAPLTATRSLFTFEAERGSAVPGSSEMSLNLSSVPAGRHSPSGDTSISLIGSSLMTSSTLSRYESTCRNSTQLFLMVCGHCHLCERCTITRKASRSNTLIPLTSVKRAGFLTRIPVRGHFKLMTVESTSMSSSLSSPAQTLPLMACRMRCWASSNDSLGAIMPLTSARLRGLTRAVTRTNGRGSTAVSWIVLAPSLQCFPTLKESSRLLAPSLVALPLLYTR